MTGIRIGEAYYAHLEDAMIPCDCGHTVLLNQAEEVWTDGKVTDLCDACFFSQEGDVWNNTSPR
jgi:hypothetical protein